MRFSLVFSVVLCSYVGKYIVTPIPTLSPPTKKSYTNFHKQHQFEIINYNIFKLFFLASVYFSLLWLSLLQLCNHVKYVTFDTNLCTRRKATTVKLPDCSWSPLLLIMLGLLFCECPDFSLIMVIISINSICGSVVNLILRFSKIMSRTIFNILCIYIYSIALTPATCILSLMVFQAWCHLLTKNVPLVTNYSDFIVK